jgi:hypothetical protein
MESPGCMTDRGSNADTGGEGAWPPAEPERTAFCVLYFLELGRFSFGDQGFAK